MVFSHLVPHFLGLHLAGNLLHLPHDAQDIAAQDLLQIFLAIAATGEFADQVGNLGNVFHAARRGVNAVEVGAQADVIDAAHLDGMIDVVGDGGVRLGAGKSLVSAARLSTSSSVGKALALLRAYRARAAATAASTCFSIFLLARRGSPGSRNPE